MEHFEVARCLRKACTLLVLLTLHREFALRQLYVMLQVGINRGHTQVIAMLLDSFFLLFFVLEECVQLECLLVEFV